MIPIRRHLAIGRDAEEPVAASRIKGAARSPLLPTSPRLLVRNLRRLIDSSRQIARYSSINGYTRLHEKGEFSDDRDTLCSNYTANITVYIHIESRAYSLTGCLSFFHFLHFDVRRIVRCCPLFESSRREPLCIFLKWKTGEACRVHRIILFSSNFSGELSHVGMSRDE